MDARVDVDTLLEQSRWLRALALRLARDDASADDLVQDTLVAAIERPPPRSDGVGGLRGWLAKVLRNRAREEARSERIRAHHEPRAARTESIDDQPDQALDQVRLQRALAAAILDLPEPYRKAITLRWVDGLSAREVAAAQGVTYEAARQRLARGAAMLRERLDREWGRHDAWSAIALMVPRKIASHPTLPLPQVLLMSTLVKVTIAAVVLLAVCLWLGFGRHARTPVPPFSTLQPDTAALELPTTPAQPHDPARIGERSALSTVGDSALDDRERLLSGIVLDPEGAPVAGARVEARHNPNAGYGGLDLDSSKAETGVALTKSDSDGHFRLDVEPGRPLALVVQADPFAVARLPFRYPGENVVVHLERAAVLNVRVLRATDDAPVARASVHLRPRRVDKDSAPRDSRDVIEGETDASGLFRAERLPAGAINVKVVPLEECPSWWRKVDLSAGEIASIDIHVDVGPTVMGTVVDARTKLPIAGATVGENWVMDRPVRTDALGEYVLKSFPIQGVYEIGVRAKGHGYRTIQVRSGDQSPFPKRLDVELKPSRSARGRLLDARGKPVAKALVAGVASNMHGTQQIDWITTTTTAAGTFELADLRPDVPHALHVRCEGFGTVTYEFPPDELQLDVVDLGDVVLADMTIVRGRVRRPDGSAVADHVVTLTGWNSDRLRSGAGQQQGLDSYIGERQARTDAEGRFVFADVAAGTYGLGTRASGANQAVSRSFEVHAGERLEGLELELAAGLSIAGQLVGPDGEQVSGCYVSVDPVPGDLADANSSKTSADVQSDDQGRFRASGLEPGEYKLSVFCFVPSDQRRDKKQYVYQESSPVRAGDERVVVVMQIANVLRGRVVDANGKPVAHAFVIVLGKRPGFESKRAQVGEDGRFEIQLPTDLDFDLVAGPPPADALRAGALQTDSTAGPGTTTAMHPATPDAQAMPDPAFSVRRSGLRTADVEVEMKLPLPFDGR